MPNNNETAKAILRTFATAATIGAGVRGGQSLLGLVGRNAPSKSRSLTSIEADIPVPVVEEEKSANEPWWSPAAQMAAGMTGLAGGYKLVDDYFDARRKADKDQELEEAKAKFRKALLAIQTKAAALDAEFDRLGKAAGDGVAETVGRWTGDALSSVGTGMYEGSLAALKRLLGPAVEQALPAYGAYAVAAGLPSAAVMYNKARGGQTRQLLEKARRQRLAAMFRNTPPSIYAVPTREDGGEI